MYERKAFTLVEVLISIALLGIILPILFSSVESLRMSNKHLLTYLERAKKVSKATEVLYMDIIGSDGNISIKKDEFTRLCIEDTSNSLYALPTAKVCWVVLKNQKTLARVEGNAYALPLGIEERVEVDIVMKDMVLFDVYHKKDKVLVLLEQKGKEAISFMVHGISKAEKRKKKKPNKKPRKRNTPSLAAGTNSITPEGR